MFDQAVDQINRWRRESLPLLPTVGDPAEGKTVTAKLQAVGVKHRPLVLAIVFLVLVAWWRLGGTASSEYEAYFSDWQSEESGGFRWHSVEAPARPLWESVAHDSEYLIRKRLILHAFHGINAKRVFEFGSNNGGLLAQSAFLDPVINQTVKHWVHATTSAISLEYANLLFGDDDLMGDDSADLDVARASMPKGWQAQSPFNRVSGSTDNQALRSLQAVDVDIANLKSWITVLELDKFDVLLAPSLDDHRTTLAILLAMPHNSKVVFCTTSGPSSPFTNEAGIKDYLKEFLRVDRVVRAAHAGRSTFLVEGTIGA